MSRLFQLFTGNQALEAPIPIVSWSLPTWHARENVRADALFALAHVITALIFLLNRTSGTDAALTGFPIDDSWIHLVYAQSFAELRGFEYNPGQPETGATSPLWVMVLAPLFWLKPLWGGSLVAGVKGLGVLIAWANSAIAYRLLRRLTGLEAAGIAAGLMIAVDPYLGFAKVSGMEVLLFAGIGLYLLWSLAERRLLGAVLALALLPVARPEGAVLWAMGALCIGVLLVQERQFARIPLAFLPTGVAVGSWMAYCLWVTGRVLPATYYVKHSKHAGWWNQANIDAIGTLFNRTPWLNTFAGLLFAILGIVVLCWPKTRAFDQWVLRATVLVYPPLFLYGLARVHVISDPMAFYWGRYIHPVFPFLFLIQAAGVGFALTIAWRHWHRGLPLLAVVLLLMVPAKPLNRQTQRLADLFSSNCMNQNEVNKVIGLWIDQNVPQDSTVSIVNAGAQRFFGKRHTIDILGLNNHRVLFEGPRAVLRETPAEYRVVFENKHTAYLDNDVSYERVFAATSEPYTVCNCNQGTQVVYRKRPRSEWNSDIRITAP